MLVNILFIIYKFVLIFTIDGLYGLIISFVVSFLISSFVLNQFKYSNNKLIRILQKLLVYNTIIFVLILSASALAGAASSYFNIEIFSKVYCAGPDEVGSNLPDGGEVNQSQTKVSITSESEASDKKQYKFVIFSLRKSYKFVCSLIIKIKEHYYNLKKNFIKLQNLK